MKVFNVYMSWVYILHNKMCLSMIWLVTVWMDVRDEEDDSYYWKIMFAVMLGGCLSHLNNEKEWGNPFYRTIFNAFLMCKTCAEYGKAIIHSGKNTKVPNSTTNLAESSRCYCIAYTCICGTWRWCLNYYRKEQVVLAQALLTVVARRVRLFVYHLCT